MKILLSVTICIFAMVTADYFGYLGVKKESELDYFEVKFAAENAMSNEKIVDFFINCSSKNNRNACSIVQGQKMLERKVKFAVVKQIKKTWLFSKDEVIVGEVDVHLMFIHPDYDRLTQTFSITELLERQDKAIIVKLTKVASE